MKTYHSLKAQIDKLEKQAETLRKAEIGKVIGQLKKTISEYALTAADLGLDGSRARKSASSGKPRRSRGAVGVAKYRNPASGATWTGHGRPPTWILEAKDRSAFLIDSAAAASASAPAPAPAKRARASAKSKAAKRAGNGAARKARGRKAAGAAAAAA
jgi:DNA-binding protein H-NS